MKFCLVPKIALVVLGLCMAAGCGSKKGTVAGAANENMPIFSLATSEYPSWSTFVVAKKAGLINGTAEGEPGTLEKKWGVRLKLEVKDYDPCIVRRITA